MSNQKRFIDYLPAIYQSNEFLRRFMQIFEDLYVPVDDILDHVADYFDPDLTASDFLPWLAGWIALTLDENWTKEKQRLLLRHAAELYRWRGTRRGLRAYLHIYLGKADMRQIYYDDDLVRIEEDLNPMNGNSFHFTVHVSGKGLTAEERDRLEDHIFTQKPAHTVFTLKWI